MNIQQNVSLKGYSSWRAGGDAEVLFTPRDLDELVTFLKQPEYKKLDLTWLGLGSNTLIRDGGIKGCVIVTLPGLGSISNENGLLRLEAGVACAQAARYISKQNLTGIEFLAGIPGTIGGALAMNAGCFGGETWDYIEKVDVINRDGELRTREKHEYEVGYRYVKQYPEEWFIAGYFRLENKTSQSQGAEKIKELLAKRKATQPIGEFNCGSVFRNPEGDFAARLIEASGLKGYCINDACVSTKHANFIINFGNAKASDIENLIQYVHEAVKNQHGIDLQREVKIIGAY